MRRAAPSRVTGGALLAGALLGRLVLGGALAACGGGPAGPAPVDALHDACGSCRMIVSDPRLAAQIVAPGEEPRFFDDLRCLRDFLAGAAPLPPEATAYVADHRTGAWVPARRALYVRAPSIATPMGSSWAAYADETSRGADPDARGSIVIPPETIFGSAPPGGPAGAGDGARGA